MDRGRKRSRSPETDQHRSLSPDPGRRSPAAPRARRYRRRQASSDGSLSPAVAQRRPQGAASRDSISKSPSPSLRRRQSPELRRREHERHHRRDDDPDSRPQEYHRHRDRDEGRPRDRYDDRPHRDDRRDRYQEQDRHSNRRGYEDRRDRYDDRNRDRYVRRSPSRGYERSQYGREQLPLAPEVGSILRGTISNIRGFGAFCKLEGYLKDGLIHSSQIHEELVLSRDEDDADKIKAMGFYANRDDKVWVKILSVEEGPGGPKVACSMKAVSQEDGRDLDPDNRLASRGGGAPRGAGAGINAGRANLSNEAPPIGSVHKASVMSIKPFGVFVAMEGFRSNGLVHLTQVADHLDINRDDSDDSKVASLGAVVAPGEQIWCKVVEVKEGDERGPRIGCSIKMVSQRDGQDLDPEMTNYFAKGEGGGGGGPRRGGPVGSAVAELKEGGVVDWGHLKAEDTRLGHGDQGYDLLKDEGPRNGVAAPAAAPQAAMGRGREATKPAWMTNPGASIAPGSAAAPAGPQSELTVQEAMAILAAAKSKHKKSKHKKSKDSHKKKSKKEHKGKSKSKKHRRRDSCSGSSSEDD